MSLASLTPTTTPPNLLQRLPAEIRHIIYTHLNIPIGTYAWLDCPGPPHCRIASHVIFHEDAKWPMLWHALPGTFQIRRKMEGIEMTGTMYKMKVKYDMNGVKLWAHVNIDNGLLGVNKEVRNEVLSSMVGGVDVSFEYALRGDDMVGPCSLTACFAYLTSVTLDQSQRYGHASSLGIKTESIWFLAKYSPRLLSLTCVCRSGSSWDGSEQLGFMQACHAITASSTKLEVLRIKGADAKGGHVVVNKTLHKEEFGGCMQWVSESMTEVLGME